MNLTKRETQIMSLMEKGLLNKEIAKELNISKRTIETYVRKIYVKIGAKNRSNAVSIFVVKEQSKNMTLPFEGSLMYYKK